jgi:hypothetical protein
MKTWVFCAESNYAKVFQTSENHGIQYCRDVITTPGERRRFCRYLADEIEIACRSGVDGRLLICGDPALVNNVCQCLSDAVRSLIIGIVPKNVLREPVDRICERTSQVVESWEDKHGLLFCA